MLVFGGVYFVTYYYGHHRSWPSFAYKKTSPKPMGMMEMFASRIAEELCPKRWFKV